MAALGFVVVAIDGRGSPGRDKAFHDASYGRVADGAGLADHVAVLRELGRDRPWLDLDRVGVFGMSSGGFAAVRAMLEFPEFFRAGVAECGMHDLRYAEQRSLPDGGREIILATDRPMSFWEITNRPLSSEYPFTWVQFRVRPDGTGDGTLAVAARIVGEEADDLIEVQDFAIQPVRLQNIRSKSSN